MELSFRQRVSENVALKRADIQFFPYFHSSSGFTYLFRKKTEKQMSFM